MATSSYDQLSSLTDTMGALFIGFLLTGILYGVTTVQMYLYYVNYPKDRVDNKVLVAVVWILDTTHTVLVTICMYHYLIQNYGNTAALSSGHWSLFVSMTVNAFIALFVHTFFTLQIFRFSKRKVRWWLASITGLLVIAQFCLGIETSVFLFLKKDFSKLNSVTLYAIVPLCTFAVLSDIVIAVALCVLLQGKRTGLDRTNTLLNTLMIYAINRCVLTSVVAVAEVTVFAISPESLWFWAIDFVIGKLYANSLLATLNGRHSLRTSISMPDVSRIMREVDAIPESAVKNHILEFQAHDNSTDEGDFELHAINAIKDDT